MCPKKIPPSSPKCKAANSSENVYPCENASQAPSSSKLNDRKFLYCNVNAKPNDLDCNAILKPRTEGGGCGSKKSLLPFQPGQNSEVIKEPGGRKGKILSENKVPKPTSDMVSFCLSTVTHADSLSSGEPNISTNPSQKTKKPALFVKIVKILFWV